MSSVARENLRFYSQHGEDQVLWEFFGFKSDGCFIEVGAFDGIYLSNTYSFYEQGWRGICVEAHADFFEKLLTNRPKDTCVHAACLDRDGGSVEFFSEPHGLYSTASNDPEVIKQIQNRYASKEVSLTGAVRTQVRTVSLGTLQSQLAESGREIDFISIDVEGSELDVLSGATLAGSPRVYILEANDESSAAEIKRAMVAEKGYILARNLGVNLIFTRTAEDAIRIRDIPVRYVAEKMLHPLGKAYSLPEYETGHIVDEVRDRELQELRSYRTFAQRKIDAFESRIEQFKHSRARDSEQLAEMTSTQQVATRRLGHLQDRIDALAESKAVQTRQLHRLEREAQTLRQRCREMEDTIRTRDERIEAMASGYRLGFAILHPLKAARKMLNRIVSWAASARKTHHS